MLELNFWYFIENLPGREAVESFKQQTNKPNKENLNNLEEDSNCFLWIFSAILPQHMVLACSQ